MEQSSNVVLTAGTPQLLRPPNLVLTSLPLPCTLWQDGDTYHICGRDSCRHPSACGIADLVLIHLFQHLTLVDVYVQEESG